MKLIDQPTVIIAVLMITHALTWTIAKEAANRWWQAHPITVQVRSPTPAFQTVTIGSESKPNMPGLYLKGRQLYVAKKGWDLYCIVVDAHPKGSTSVNGIIRPNYEMRDCWPAERTPAQ